MADPPWQSFADRGLYVLALIYFVFCFAMSRYSRGLEREFGARTGADGRDDAMSQAAELPARMPRHPRSCWTR